jgi:hypothetical protein
MEEQKEGQTNLLDKEIFVLNKNKSIYFKKGTLQLELIGHELISQNAETKQYGFKMLFKELQKGQYEMIDDYVKIYYLKSLTSNDCMKIPYTLKDYRVSNGKTYGFVTIMDITEDINHFILYLKICNTKNKFYRS